MPKSFYSSEKKSFAADINRPDGGQALPFKVAPSTQDDNGSAAKISVLVHNITLLSDDDPQSTTGTEQLRYLGFMFSI